MKGCCTVMINVSFLSSQSLPLDWLVHSLTSVPSHLQEKLDFLKQNRDSGGIGLTQLNL